MNLDDFQRMQVLKQKRESRLLIMGTLMLLLFAIACNALADDKNIVNHGLSISNGFGMVNTLNDNGQNPDTTTYTLDIDYFRVATTSFVNVKSYLKTGFEWDTSLGGAFTDNLMDLSGLGVNIDGGVVLWNLWRIGVGISFNYQVKDLQNNIGKYFTISPYFETGIFWKCFEHSGLDFAFHLATPVDITGQTEKPYFNMKGQSAIAWQFSLTYVIFLK